MAGVLGGDLVGMSTALETIAAREARPRGARHLAGDQPGRRHLPEPLNHTEVLEAGRAAAPRLRTLLAGIAAAL